MTVLRFVTVPLSAVHGIAQYAGTFSAVLKNDGSILLAVDGTSFFDVLCWRYCKMTVPPSAVDGTSKLDGTCRVRMEHAGKMQNVNPVIKPSDRHIYLISSNWPPRAKQHATRREPKTSSKQPRQTETDRLKLPLPAAEPRLSLSPLSTFYLKLGSTVWFALVSWAAFLSSVQSWLPLLAPARHCSIQLPCPRNKKNTEKHRKTKRGKKHTHKHTHTQNRVAGLELTPSVPLLDETFTPYTRTRGHLATPLRPCREGFVLWRK